jgi:hypothetical protein
MESRRISVLIVVFVAACFLVAEATEAAMVRGSVGSGGTKRYYYYPDASGHSQLHLIFDNKSSDLDLILGYTSSEGDAVIVGTGLSTAVNYERMESGVSSNITYTILVDSYRGPSPFRLVVTTSSYETAYPVTMIPARPGRPAGGSITEGKVDRPALDLLKYANRIKELMR